MKKRKFQAGGISDDVRARALKYASMAGPGKEESKEQKDFVQKVRRSQEDPLRSVIAAAEARDAARRKPAKMSPAMEDVMRVSRANDELRKASADMDRKEIPAGMAEYGNPMQEASEKMRRQRMTETDVPYETTPPAGRKPFGSRVMDALTRGGATDIRNMIGAAVPALSRARIPVKPVKMADEVEEVVQAGTRRAAAERAKRMSQADKVRAAQERRKALTEARKSRDVSRMEGESMGTVTPRMNPKREVRPPQDMDELRMSGEGMGFKKGGKAKFAKGGSVSARADGIAKRGKTNCKVC